MTQDPFLENLRLLMRELANNPDSPVSLQVQSHINSALRPRQEAVQRAVEAFADQITEPAPGAQERFDAAIANYQSVIGECTPDLVEKFRADAHALVLERWRRPPLIESIIPGTADRSDVGYQLGFGLGGLRGTWHRLWSMCSTAYQWDENVEDLAAPVLSQFEALLGRAITPEEWSQLKAHAKVHAERVKSGVFSSLK